MMNNSVDLASGHEGVVTLRSGQKFFCLIVEPEGDIFRVRIESGWYHPYERAGTARNEPGYVQCSDIVEFIPCGFRDPRAAATRTDAENDYIARRLEQNRLRAQNAAKQREAQ